MYWPHDKKLYPGTVTHYAKNTKKHKIEYDDRDIDL